MQPEQYKCAAQRKQGRESSMVAPHPVSFSAAAVVSVRYTPRISRYAENMPA
jgi:hypothetical protein